MEDYLSQYVKLNNGGILNRFDLHFEVEGDGDTIVFIHGLSDSLLYWEFLATNLKDDYQIVRIDLRGHGQSQLGSEQLTVDLYVVDLINLLDELNIAKVNLVGFSLGGAVALDFTLKCPQKVSSLVLMSSFAKADNHLTDVFKQFKDALNNSFEDFYDLIVPMVFCPEYINNNKEEFELLKEILSPDSNVYAYIKAIDACLTFDVENELSCINVPALILAGQYDEITTLDIQKRMAGKIKNSNLIVLENTKHNLLVGQNNQKILAILKNFYMCK